MTTSANVLTNIEITLSGDNIYNPCAKLRETKMNQQKDMASTRMFGRLSIGCLRRNCFGTG